jgi:glucose 1-dehydrogenase
VEGQVEIGTALSGTLRRKRDGSTRCAFLSKGCGMRMLTRTAGVELAGHNIYVVGVGRGAVATPINVGTMHNPTQLAQLNKAISVGRMARPEKIASVVGFLAGEGASYLAATTIFADGGIMHSSVGL